MFFRLSGVPSYVGVINKWSLSTYILKCKINSFSPCCQEDVEANFGDLKKAKKERNYKILRTIATFTFFLFTVVLYVCHTFIGFPIILEKALKFFGKIVGTTLVNASFKDFAYANTEGGLISEDIFTLVPCALWPKTVSAKQKISTPKRPQHES